MKNTKQTDGKTSQEMEKADYWQGQWKVGTRVCVTDGEWTTGWGIIIALHQDTNWADVKLEENDKVVDGYKGYCYRMAD